MKLKQETQGAVTYEQLKAFIQQTLLNSGSRDAAIISLIEALNQAAQNELLSEQFDSAVNCLRLIIELCTENNPDKQITIINNTLQNLLLIFKTKGAPSYEVADQLLVNFYQKFKEKYKDKTFLPQIYTLFCRGQIALKEKKYDKALACFEKTLNKNRHQSELPEQDLAHVYASLGSLLVTNNRLKEGKIYLQKALLIYQKYYDANHKFILKIKNRLNYATLAALEEQTDTILDEVTPDEEQLLDLSTYVKIPSCDVKMRILDSSVVFSFKGTSAEDIKALNKILTGPQNLLAFINDASQYGQWTVSDRLPCKESDKDQLHLMYVDKNIQHIFENNSHEMFPIRNQKIRDYFRENRSQIWYQSLVELSCYFHLPLLSRAEKQWNAPKDEGLTLNLGRLQYVLKQDPLRVFNIKENLFNLLALIANSKEPFQQSEAIRDLASIPVEQLINKIDTVTEEEIATILTDINQPLALLKDILFQAYSGKEVMPGFTPHGWVAIINCLQSLSLFKVGFVRQQIFLQGVEQTALWEHEQLQQQKDYKALQQSKIEALKDQQGGPLIIADEHYPERNPKGWPFSRTLPMIEKLHGSWNTRQTLDDKTMASQKQNRFDFGKVIQKNEVVIDFGAGNGNFLRDLREAYPESYLVAVGIDPLDDRNLALIDEIWYMPLALAEHIEAFVERFKNKAGLITCSFGATTYASDPKLVVILASYLLRRGGHFSAIISSQPGHFDGTPLGYTDDREELAAFIKKYFSSTMVARWTAIESAVVPGSKFIDFKLDITRPLDAPEVSFSLEQLFKLADVEIGSPQKLKAHPSHPYQFKTQSIEMRQFLQPGEEPRNNLLETMHIKQSMLEIVPIKDFGLVFKIVLAIDSLPVLNKYYRRLQERIVQSTESQIVPVWTVEKNISGNEITINYIDPDSRHAVLNGDYLPYLANLAAKTNATTEIWKNLIETLFYNGIVISGVIEKIDGYQYPQLSERYVQFASRAITLAEVDGNTALSIPFSNEPSLALTMVADEPLPHPETGKPVFTFQLFGQYYEEGPRENMGKISFYERPKLCQKNGRHNIIYADGLFATVKIDIDAITTECDSLPPTLTEKCLTSLIDGGIHGAIRGSANVIGNRVGKSYSLSNIAKNLVVEGVYYYSYFNYQVMRHAYNNVHNDDISTHDILCKALADTGNVWIANTTVWCTKKLIDIVNYSAKAHQWQRTSKVLDQISKYIGFTIFGANALANAYQAKVPEWENSEGTNKWLDFTIFAAEQYVMPGATAIIAGAAVQTAIELGADKLLPIKGNSS